MEMTKGVATPHRGTQQTVTVTASDGRNNGGARTRANLISYLSYLRLEDARCR
jgi:hypothetical protein